MESNIDREIRLRRHVLSEFERLCSSLHGNPDQVFDHLLAYIVHGFHIGGEPLNWWTYTQAQTERFHVFMLEWTKSLAEILKEKAWYDFFGEIYETCVAGRGRKSGNGQFFTPANVCDLMAGIVIPQDQDEVADPCCGSGRLLLSAHAQNPKAVLHAADLDRTCVMMTLCNFLAHGCTGTVEWADSLKNESYETWVVNPEINNARSPLCGLPHCAKVEQPEQRATA